MGDSERQRRLLNPPRHGRRRLAAVLEPEGQFRPDGAQHHLRLGVLKQAPDGLG